MKRLPIILSLLALIALAASIAYWVLQLYQPPQRPLAAAPQAALPEPSIDAAATVFGGQAATALATNYTLTGVVAAGRESVAIIVAEGSPPKALRIGKEVVPGVTISEVHPRYVMLSDGGIMKRIDLPSDSKAAAAANPGGPAASAPPGEPQVSPGPVQAQEPQQAETPAPAQTPSQAGRPSPTPEPPQAASPTPAPAPAAPQPAAPATQAGAATTTPPPPAPVQMPPPVRAQSNPANPPPVAQ
jgi:general secretion pathway protein C